MYIIYIIIAVFGPGTRVWDWTGCSRI